MNSYTQILYQIVFSTKHRKPTLSKNNRPKLFKYIWGILKAKRCHLYRINGVEDHIHIVTHIHQSVALASLMREIKASSSAYIKREKLFKGFEGWQSGYAAFTYSIDARHNLIQYVNNQEAHHNKGKSSLEEMRELLIENDVAFEEEYLD